MRLNNTESMIMIGAAMELNGATIIKKILTTAIRRAVAECSVEVLARSCNSGAMKRCVGKKLALYILNSIKNEKVIYLHAQESVIDFYSKLGFKRIGSQFFEAEIPHQKMIYNHRHT